MTPLILPQMCIRDRPEGTHRDYGLCRRLPDGILQPIGLPEWRWDTFFIAIVRSCLLYTSSERLFKSAVL